MAFKQLKFVLKFVFKLQTHFRLLHHIFQSYRKQERQMARQFAIMTNGQTNFPEEGEFLSTDAINQLYIRKLRCLTKS